MPGVATPGTPASGVAIFCSAATTGAAAPAGAAMPGVETPGTPACGVAIFCSAATTGAAAPARVATLGIVSRGAANKTATGVDGVAARRASKARAGSAGLNVRGNDVATGAIMGLDWFGENPNGTMTRAKGIAPNALTRTWVKARGSPLTAAVKTGTKNGRVPAAITGTMILGCRARGATMTPGTSGRGTRTNGTGGTPGTRTVGRFTAIFGMTNFGTLTSK